MQDTRYVVLEPLEWIHLFKWTGQLLIFRHAKGPDICGHSRAGALEALKKTSVLRLIYPSAEADAVYIQALKMLAFTTPSAHFRSCYLTEVMNALGHLPIFP